MSEFLSKLKGYSDLGLHGVRMPTFEITQKMCEEAGIPNTRDTYEFMRQICLKSFREKGLDKVPNKAEYIDRIKSELSTLKELGFIDYLLIIWDIINFAKTNDIAVGSGRGCLNYDSLVKTPFGYKKLGEITVGERVVSSNGQYNDVLAIHRYPCKEKLISFKTSFSTHDQVKMTFDHKVFCLKNPFKFNTVQKCINKEKAMSQLRDFQWIEAQNVNTGDYLVRYCGRSEPIKDIDYIDLAEFADEQDDKYVWEWKGIVGHRDLSMRFIHRETGLSRNFLREVKRSQGTRRGGSYKKLLNYLNDKGFTIEDFINEKSKKQIKIKRYLEIDQDFCYLLGFFIGDGWVNSRGLEVGFAFNSVVDQERIKRVSNILEKYGFEWKFFKAKNKNLLQMIICCKFFNRFLSHLVPGRTNFKKIPYRFMLLPDHKLKEILNGLMDSDGSIDKNGRKNFDSTSLDLARQVFWLMELFGETCSINKRTYQDNCKDSFKVRNSTGGRYNSFNIGNYVLTRVNEINIHENKEDVYDITVDKDPSYSTPNFIVHNSGAGSAILYLSGITRVDPIKYDLLFERFISKARSKSEIIDGVTYFTGSLPDIDTDFSWDRRGEVIEYIQKKYDQRTCKVLTIGTLQGKACIKECCKVVSNYTEDEATDVTSRIEKVFGVVQDLADAEKEGLKKWAALPRDRYRLYSNKDILKIAKKLEGLPNNFGVHASAMAVSYYPLAKFCPTQLTKDGELVSGYTKDDIERLMLKVDALGLKTMTVLSRLAKETGYHYDGINTDDPEIYKAMVSWGENLYGIFQFEGHTALDATIKVKPESLDELAIINSLARPGAKMYIEEYAKRKFGGQKVKEIHPVLDEILKPSQGIIVFQEQLMAIANKVFGFSLEDAETLRRLISKKKESEMAEWEEKIRKNCLDRGMDISVFDYYWESLRAAASYSFNKSHALAYSILASQCAYYKWKYSLDFFCEYFKMAKHANQADGGPQGEISKIVKELPYFSIKLLPPDILKSDVDFTKEGSGSIRYGLLSIKGIAEKKIEALKEFRGEYPNKFELFLAAKSSGLTIGNLSALIQAGAMDSATNDRCLTVLEAQTWNKLTEREKTYMIKFGADHEYDLFKIMKMWVAEETKDEKGKKAIIPASRYETIKKHCEKYLEIYRKNKKYESLANWFFERKLLGYSYSGSLYEILGQEIGNLMDMRGFAGEADDTVCNYAGIVVDARDRKSKSGNNMFTMEIADNESSIIVRLMNYKYDNWVSDHRDDNGKIPWPEKESLVVVSGRKSGTTIFLDNIYKLDEKIYFKLSDLK